MRLFLILSLLLSVSVATAREHKTTIDSSTYSTSLHLRKLDGNSTVVHKPNIPKIESGSKSSGSSTSSVSSSSSSGGSSSGSSSSKSGSSSASKVGGAGHKSGSSTHHHPIPLQSTGMMLVGAAVVGAVALVAVAMRRPEKEQLLSEHALMGSVERRMSLFSRIASSGIAGRAKRHRYPEEEIDFEDKYSVMADPIEMDRARSESSNDFESRDEIEGRSKNRWNLFPHLATSHSETDDSRDTEMIV
mmetsp:Transcript_25252/g.35609  ORF Transcript_25252/g.35609 Transcript_25252/m.35609 type:complete len:246 (-) Transcript_25252:114-851(-)